MVTARGIMIPDERNVVHVVNSLRSNTAIAICPLALLVSFSIDITNFNVISPAQAQPATLTRAQLEQLDALDVYRKALSAFKAILSERRAQISAHQKLPEVPGQALYLARVAMMSAYKDLTDANPSKIGRPNEFRIPPAYFDADTESLIDEYKDIFKIMQAPPPHAQNSDTPFQDIVDLGTVIARAESLDTINAIAAGRISLGVFFAETDGNQNIGNARSGKYKGSFQTGVVEDRNGQQKWTAIKKVVRVIDPVLSARDDKEEARVGNSDQRFNHWTGVRNGLMNVHADLFRQIPTIVKALPDPIDQMKFFELIQIIPSPTKAALNSGNPSNYRISDPTMMFYLRNNSRFAIIFAGS